MMMWTSNNPKGTIYVLSFDDRIRMNLPEHLQKKKANQNCFRDVGNCMANTTRYVVYK